MSNEQLVMINECSIRTLKTKTRPISLPDTSDVILRKDLQQKNRQRIDGFQIFISEYNYFLSSSKNSS